jgi:hypothetical protein
MLASEYRRIDSCSPFPTSKDLSLGHRPLPVTTAAVAIYVCVREMREGERDREIERGGGVIVGMDGQPSQFFFLKQRVKRRACAWKSTQV